MYDFKHEMEYSEASGNPIRGLVPLSKNLKDESDLKLPGLVSELMETSWLKPLPVGTKSIKVGSRQFDVIQTMLSNKRVDFMLDRDTHLPAQVSFYNNDSVSQKTVINSITFSDYLSVGGVMMASQQGFAGESGKYKRIFQFNVDYDEDIFLKPPSFELGAEAWKKK